MQDDQNLETLHQLEAEQGIKGGRIDTKTRTSHISWIPFKKMPEMYKQLEKVMKQTNGNHFGFDGMQITEHGTIHRISRRWVL